MSASSELARGCALWFSLATTPAWAWQSEFIRGDANGDATANPSGPVDIADAVFILGYLFSEGPAPSCLQASDANDDESVDLADAVFVLSGLFSGGPPPAAPFPTCGPDATPSPLPCSAYPPCGTVLPSFAGLTHAGRNSQGYEEYTLDLDPTIVLILVPGGTFEMGQVGVASSAMLQVTLSPYLISKYEITNAQYKNFCDLTGWPYPPTDACCGFPTDHLTNPLYADHAVVNVSWDEVNAPAGFLAWTGLALPTEAQWEYAARSTTGWTFPWGDDPPGTDEIFHANGCWTYGCGADDGWVYTNPVGAYADHCGPFGTLGQAGNVQEYCSDFYGPYPAGPETDPIGPPAGTTRVIRGGGWLSFTYALQSAFRGGTAGYDPCEYYGFRPAMPIP